MIRRIAFLLALAIGFSASAAYACPGEQATQDGKPQSTPIKPKTSS